MFFLEVASFFLQCFIRIKLKKLNFLGSIWIMIYKNLKESIELNKKWYTAIIYTYEMQIRTRWLVCAYKSI